jgi:hypothetical protein
LPQQCYRHNHSTGRKCPQSQNTLESHADNDLHILVHHLGLVHARKWHIRYRLAQEAAQRLPSRSQLVEQEFVNWYGSFDAFVVFEVDFPAFGLEIFLAVGSADAF